MSNYAYVENKNIVHVTWGLPNNWKNVSNFFALEGDDTYLKTIGWYKIEKIEVSYDPQFKKIDGIERWYDENLDKVFEREIVVDIPNLPTAEELEQLKVSKLPYQWERVREHRNELMQKFEWRYARYDRQVRLSLTPTDDLFKMDEYMQALADVTTQPDPYNITWPTYNS